MNLWQLVQLLNGETGSIAALLEEIRSDDREPPVNNTIKGDALQQYLADRVMNMSADAVACLAALRTLLNTLPLTPLEQLLHEANCVVVRDDDLSQLEGMLAPLWLKPRVDPSVTRIDVVEPSGEEGVCRSSVQIPGRRICDDDLVLALQCLAHLGSGIAFGDRALLVRLPKGDPSMDRFVSILGDAFEQRYLLEVINGKIWDGAVHYPFPVLTVPDDASDE